MRWPAGTLLMLAIMPAHAALTLCNRSSDILYAATAATTGRQVTAQGWTRILPGDCQVARPEALTMSGYLVHAHSSPGLPGPPHAWGGNRFVCVRDGNFTLAQDGRANCTAPGTHALPFAALDTHGKPSWTMNFDDQPPLPSLLAAQLTGVKRLLAANGYRIDHVDATPDRQTGAALKDFRARMHFAPDAGNYALFAALEAGAKAAKHKP